MWRLSRRLSTCARRHEKRGQQPLQPKQRERTSRIRKAQHDGRQACVAKMSTLRSSVNWSGSLPSEPDSFRDVAKRVSAMRNALILKSTLQRAVTPEEAGKPLQGEQGAATLLGPRKEKIIADHVHLMRAHNFAVFKDSIQKIGCELCVPLLLCVLLLRGMLSRGQRGLRAVLLPAHVLSMLSCGLGVGCEQ